jgi:hypothetical protein
MKWFATPNLAGALGHTGAVFRAGNLGHTGA